jgi:hypothetical protein
LQAATDLFPAESFLEALRHALHGNQQLLALNQEAFARGVGAVKASRDR